MTVAVSDLDASLRFYRGLAGDDVRIGKPSEWRTDAAIGRLRHIDDVPFRTAAIELPGSSVVLELVEYRTGARRSYRPTFQDIGHAHVALIVSDIQAIVDRMKAQGASSIAKSGTWTQITPTTRAVYTRDPDGFFLEILERR
jgi:catechol 2,3-dioxygenase-like lactoylglutathione lyase family enzyme